MQTATMTPAAAPAEEDVHMGHNAKHPDRVRRGATDARWAQDVIWWHVYPLGFVGAPIRATNEERAQVRPRLRRLIDYLDYAVELGVTGLILGPIFAAQSHGYDTVDHYRIDPRLGTEADFDALIAACHARGLRIVLDGVFSHVGDQHPWLRDDLAKGQGASDLFDIDWNAGGGPRPRVWEGHGSLARLNHASDTAANFVLGVMRYWLDRGVDGWRLDAAYSVPSEFWTRVLPQIRREFPGVWFLGEVIHGDYASYVAKTHVDTITQYELWKAIWSSLNDANLWELDWTLQRHDALLDSFVPQTFVGNHDVTRIATKVGARRAIAAAAILFTVGGIPSVYAGDEQGLQGVKEDRLGGDDAVRPEFPADPADLAGDPATWRAYHDLISLRKARPWLTTARTKKVELTNQRMVYATTSRDGQHRLDVVIDLTDDSMRIYEHNELIWARL